MKTKTLNFTIALILGTALASSAALAAPPPGKGKPPSEAAQNLSVPGILVGSLGTLVCGPSDLAPSALVPPTGTPLTGYELDGYYWVQKVHTWQAQCFNADTAKVFGAWGDNLAGDAKLKASSPIRVEIVLTNQTDFSLDETVPTLQGYMVKKLQPSTLDRLSAYGHLAGGNAVDGWTDIPANFPQIVDNVTCPDSLDTANPGCQAWVVHDAGMKISVQNLDTDVFVVPLQAITPEINATGKIVYGYNLRVPEAGTYRIRFNTSSTVTFTGCDAGICVPDGNDAYLDIVVGGGGGGGGGGGSGGGGKPF
jgi:hypothetical protein